MSRKCFVCAAIHTTCTASCSANVLLSARTCLDLPQCACLCAALEGGLAAQQDVHDHASRPDVRQAVVVLVEHVRRNIPAAAPHADNASVMTCALQWMHRSRLACRSVERVVHHSTVHRRPARAGAPVAAVVKNQKQSNCC
jgi:hypothetical protein